MVYVFLSLTIISICCVVIIYSFVEQIEELKKRVRYLEERELANLSTLKKVCDYLREKEDNDERENSNTKR